MISQIVMPSLGATGGDVVILEWLAQPLEAVKKGQPLFVVETDKATVEVEAFRDGFLRQILADVGTSVAIGDVVALLSDQSDEPVPSDLADAAIPVDTHATESATPPAIATNSDGRMFITPVAKRIAQENHIDFSALAGTGRDGIILKRDVLAQLADTFIPSQAGSDDRAAPCHRTTNRTE